jgi:hypothetical protein
MFSIFLKSGNFENLILYPFVSTGTTGEKQALQTISIGFLNHHLFEKLLTVLQDLMVLMINP